MPFVGRRLRVLSCLLIIASTGKQSRKPTIFGVDTMRTIKLIQDSSRFCVTATSKNFVQGVRLRDGRVVTFCRVSGKIVKNSLVVKENQAHNRALLKKTGFVFLSLLLFVLLFVSQDTQKNTNFKNVVKNSTVDSVQVYTVQSGDNLSKIFGYKKGLKVCKLNALKDCDLIYPNQKLKF